MTASSPAAVRRPLLRLMALGRPVRASLAVAVLAGAATVGCAVALLAVSGFLLARAAQHPNIVALSIAVVVVRFLGIGRGIGCYVERLSSHDAALRVLADLRASVYVRLEQLAPTGLTSLRTGDLVARFVADVEAIQDLFIRGITPPLVALLVGAVTVFFATLVFLPGGVFLGAGLLVAGICLPALSWFWSRGPSASIATVRGELAAATVDLVDGAAELIANGAAAAAVARVEDCDSRLTAMSRRSAAAYALGVGGATLVSGATVLAVLLTGVAAVHRGSLGSVPLAVVILAALAAFEITTPLPAAAVAVAGVRTSARRIFSVLDAVSPVCDPQRPEELPNGPVHVRLSGVSVRYPGCEVDALTGIDLDLPPGKRVAVVGRSGAGKSTLAAAMMRFVDVHKGSVEVNGIDIVAMTGDQVRRVIGGCTADPHIFDSTVRENLRLADPGAADQELSDVLSAVGLSRWLIGLPEGLDSRVGAHGMALSGGQRQRLALARGLLADPAVLVLDEPTAHLDSETAAAVMRDVLALTRGRTTVLITHDVHGLAEMDEIVVLADGKISERRDLAVDASVRG